MAPCSVMGDANRLAVVVLVKSAVLHREHLEGLVRIPWRCAGAPGLRWVARGPSWALAVQRLHRRLGPLVPDWLESPPAAWLKAVGTVPKLGSPNRSIGAISRTASLFAR